MSEKIDDFEVVCKDNLGCPIPFDEPNPLRVGEEGGMRTASIRAILPGIEVLQLPRLG